MTTFRFQYPQKIRLDRLLCSALVTLFVIIFTAGAAEGMWKHSTSPNRAPYPPMSKSAWWRPYPWTTDVEYLFHFDELQASDHTVANFLAQESDRKPKTSDPHLDISLDNEENADFSLPSTVSAQEVANAKPMGRNGTLRGGAVLCREGRFGGGVRFTGGPGTLVLPKSEWGWDRTVELWIKPDELPAKSAALFHAYRPRHPMPQTATLELMSDGGLRCVWFGRPSPVTEQKIPAGKWTHIAFSYASEHGGAEHPLHVRIMINGLEALRSPIEKDPVTGGRSLLEVYYTIGNDNKGVRGFNGTIDEIRFSKALHEYYSPDLDWTGAPRSSEIQHGFPFIRDDKDLVFHLPFNGTMAAARAKPGTRVRRTVELAGFKEESDYCLPAVDGAGLVLGKGGLAPEYSGGDNLDMSAGTAAFWMRPVDWDNLMRENPFDSYNPVFVELFQVRGDFPDGEEAPPRWKGPGPLMRLLMLQNLPQGVINPPEFSPAKWSHIAVSWDREHVRYYINGNEIEGGRDLPVTLVTPDNDYWIGAPKDKHWRSTTKAESVVFLPAGGGIWHPYWHIRKEDPNTILDDFRVYNRALAPVEIQNLVSMHRPDAAPRQLPEGEVVIDYMNGMLGNLQGSVFPLMQNAGEARRLKVSLRSKNDDAVLAAIEIDVKPPHAPAFQLKSEPLSFGVYQLRAEFLNEAGTVIGTVVHDIIREEPPWWNYTKKNPARVLPEWDPVKVDGNVVSVVHRDVHIGAAGMPEKIVSRGENILARPVVVEADVAGARVLFEPVVEAPEIVAADDVRVDWQGSMKGDGLRVDTKGYIEFDGMIWLALTLRPPEDTPVELDRFTIRIPYRPVEAKFMHAKVAIRGKRTDTDYPDKLADSNLYIGATPTQKGTVFRSNDKDIISLSDERPETLRGSFISCMNLMGMQRGMAWFAENDRGWTQSDEIPAVAVERADDSVDLVLNIIVHPVTLDKPRTIEFGLHPMPLRRLHEDWRRWPGWGVPFNSSLEGSKDQLFSLMPENGDFSRVPEHWEKSRRTRELIEQERIAFKDRFGREPTPYERTVPGLFYFTPAIGWVPEHTREFKEVWETTTAGRAGIDQYFVDYAAWCFEQWAKTGIAEGAYIDGHVRGWEVVDRGNLAYTLPDGHVQPGYGWRYKREFFRRLRQAFWDQGIVPHICNHSSPGLYLPGSAYVDVWLGIEHYYHAPPSQRDFIDTWPLDRLQMCHPGKWNIIPRWLGWHAGMGHPQYKAWYYRQERAYAGLISAHDIDMPVMGKYGAKFAKMDRYRLREPETGFIGYWEEDSPAKHGYGDELLVSMWTVPAKGGEPAHAIVLVVNRGKERRAKTEIEFDTQRLGLGAAPSAVKAEDIDDRLLVYFAEDPTTMDAAGEAGQAVTGDLDIQAGDDLGLDLEERAEDLPPDERRAHDPDGKFDWKNGILTCPVRRHDYRLFRFWAE